MKKRYFFFDIDGTLTDNRTRRIVPSAALAVEKLREAGHFVALATGRAYYKSEPFRAAHGFLNMVCNGGHGIVIDGVLRENSPIDYQKALAIYHEAIALGYGVLVALNDSQEVYTRDFRFYDQCGIRKEPTTYIIDDTFDPADHDAIYKMYISVPEREEERLTLRKTIPSLRFEPEYLMFQPDEKKAGILRMLEMVGGAPEDVVVFGDDVNDLCMFEEPFYRVAMGNACDTLKEHADYIADSNVNDGIYKACLEHGWIKTSVKQRIPVNAGESHSTFLIASDLDGTLMRNNSKLSEYTKDVLRRVINCGIEFLPISGRSYRSAYDIIKDIDGIRYFLGGNGSVITEFQTEKILKQWIIPKDIAYRIYRIIRDMGGYVEMYCENDVYVEQDNIPIAYDSPVPPSLIDSLLETVIRVSSMDLMLQREIIKVNKMHIIFPDPKQRSVFAEKISHYDEIQVAYPTNNNMEVFPSSCNKDIGMEYIRNLTGIDPDNTIAFGDSNNDRAMIEYAALGIAVENSMEELKNAADLVVACNEEDGPAKYIEQRFLS